ncbi:hypothetical protein PACTADRAFT_3392 [Pachysolen tannophilus NRRL Y-2460]|uniref:Rho-GAP domain-containing protein n=1 Tax=Pachysolen tannophilus NRRL Y-2460 TaxID=669874 RepID=A0A1E4TVE4_PACTA|nr:hypothetical protein PACTADRAFT_3392 [Pachysolen tannophilus NRRL Y-2460]
MPSFADSFWTNDYLSGIDILFGKLYQGCVENDEFVSLFTTRMECELQYGKGLSQIPLQHQPNPSGFNKDDGASLKSCFLGLCNEMGGEGEYHIQVAQNIKLMVLDPFSKWSMEHKQRVQYSEKTLKTNLKNYNKHKGFLEKIQKKYFNRCRLLEDIKSQFPNEKDFYTYIDQEDKIVEEEKLREHESLNIKLGDFEYDYNNLKDILKKMLQEIPKTSYKVPILGTYQNCSTGSNIVMWLQHNLGLTNNSIENLENIGQGLIENGFLRVVGSVGQRNFLNSSQMYYQWKPYSFELAGIELEDSSVVNNIKGTAQLTNYFDDIMSNVTTKVDINDIPGLKRLIQEVKTLDKEYLNAALKLDDLRCKLEQLMIDHYSFMEKCELDRLKALKKVTLDFLASISNKITSLKSIIDKLMIYEESIQPIKDLLFLLENYRTGYYQPKVTLYDNFYQSSLKQMFGVDLSLRCRFDKKLVPLVVSSTLMYMDSIYPILENDEVRLNCWIIPVKLQLTHDLRNKLNNLLLDNDESRYSIKTMQEIYNTYGSPSIIASVLKLYLLELPDSLIPNEYFDLIKSLYAQFVGSDEANTEKRITGLINFLSNLPTCNIATLDSILTHFTRMISTVGQDSKEDNQKEMINKFVSNISNEFSTLILRSSTNNSSSSSAGLFTSKLVKDLLEHKVQIFDELKKQSRQRGNVKNSLQKSSPTSISSLPLSKKNYSGLSRNSTVQSRLQNAVDSAKKRASSSSSTSTLRTSSSELLPENSDSREEDDPEEVEETKMNNSNLKYKPLKSNHDDVISTHPMSSPHQRKVSIDGVLLTPVKARSHNNGNGNVTTTGNKGVDLHDTSSPIDEHSESKPVIIE